MQLFKAPYKRQAFIDNVLMPTFQGKVQELKIYDDQGIQPIELTANEQSYAVSAVKYGEFKTEDEIPRTVDLYEIIVNDDKQIERNRVGLGGLAKKLIIGNNAALVNFAYQNPEKRSWRVSFVARDGVFQNGEMQNVDTHPKRYTYVFGEPDETYKTALDRFFVLSNELQITINKIKDAFGVEAMSKAFFDDYRDVHYAGFVDYLMRSNFKKSTFNDNDKDVRDFVKKLLGRIVFLYFLQKKGWLGATDNHYKNGDKNFMSNFFRSAGANEAFYASWLSKLFFDALNNVRPHDDFMMPNGEIVKIPYLNGGLFEKESDKYDFLTFPAELFKNLFDFFDQYNFTIFEDSPEEHTVAVDPEMLGHIFENLLEDNKDKGAFYTPKEIVHYMTQESLIEYLHTQIPGANRTDLENFVKNKDSQLSEKFQQQIDQKLDAVKICDPAIGSGAFPMGLLQEIFGLKERIAYELGYKVWSPATVKENIIQKSIYGVDIERGAVDIARLRFWLSLIVDEEMPKALPNLDYKIVVGNSLVSKFDDTVIEIDWSEDTAKEGLFGQEIAEEKKRLLKEISVKQSEYFTADNVSKTKLNEDIRNLKLGILTKQLELMIENKGFKGETMQGLSKKQIEAWQQTQEWKKALSDLKNLKNNPNQPFNHFDWKLDFPEVLNPMVNDEIGFDIVIGNPPYIKEYTSREAFNGFRSSPYYQGKMDIWYGFACKSLELLKNNGVECFIAQNNWITSAGASILRKKILEETEIKLFTDFWNYKVFASAGIQTMIYLLKKSYPKNEYELKYSVLIEDKLANRQLHEFLNFDTKIDFGKKYSIIQNNSKFDSKQIDFNNGNLISILDKIAFSGEFRLNDLEVANGIHPHFDFVNKKMLETLGKGYKVGQGIFGLTSQELQYLNLNQNEKVLIKRYYPDTKNLNIYYSLPNDEFHIIYTTSEYKNPKSLNDKPNLKAHLDQFKDVITSDNKPYGLHRSRKEEFFKTEKIIAQRKCPNRPTFTYIDYESYFSATFYIIKSDRIDLKYLTVLLNSKLAKFWFRYKGKMQGNNYQIDKNPLINIPIKLANNNKNFIKLFEYRKVVEIFSNSFFDAHPNSQISEAFEEVIDALVFELYFPEEFAAKGIEIEKYAQEIFHPLEGLSEEEQIDSIQKVYQAIQSKENPLRIQMDNMYRELNDLLQPILSV